MASQQAKNKPLACPECGSQRLYKDGIRYTRTGEVQRYLCRNCGYRFSDPNRQKPANLNGIDGSKRVQKIHTQFLKSMEAITSYCQICAPKPEGAKNLAAEPQNEKQAAGATEQITKTTSAADVKGKIIEFLWWMEKQGYAKETIRCNNSCLRTLIHKGANLLDPESVKEVLAREKSWGQNRRRNIINAYTLFLKFNGLNWEKPKCKVERKIPFIPTEQEIDALIAGCGKKLAAFLQLLKETAMRSGEAIKLRWVDIDSGRRLITLNYPEKGSNPRMWKVSQRLIDMLNTLPKKSEYVFSNKSLKSLKSTFLKNRKRIAHKLQNPRLLRISFHTFRHWKATMEYHKTRDILHVKNMLGHKKIENTEIYITIEKTIFGDPYNEEFHVRVASTPEEIKKLLEVGYEYVCEKDGLMFFRKRK